MKKRSILIQGARQNNLRDISLEIPGNRLVVITGLSGSGKSSLAFDTIYAEGRRRYVESLSTHARMFLDRMGRPDVDLVEGLSPALSIEQAATGAGPRSTVGTVTEIYDYVRLLFARAGTPYCQKCGKRISSDTIQEMVDKIMSLPDGSRMSILATIVKNRRGAFKRELRSLVRNGFVRARIDSELYDLGNDIALDGKRRHTIEVFIDRLVRRPGIESRLADSLELGLKMGGGRVTVSLVDGPDMTFSEIFSCPDCDISIPGLEPGLFSFNTPEGACPECNGLGEKYSLTEESVIPNPCLSLEDGAIAPWHRRGSAFFRQMIEALALSYGIDLHTPWEDLKTESRRVILHGSEREIEFTIENDGESHRFKRRFEGVIPALKKKIHDRKTMGGQSSPAGEIKVINDDLGEFMIWETCPSCRGSRLRTESLCVRIGDLNIGELASMDIRTLKDFFSNLSLGKTQTVIAKKLVREIVARVDFLIDTGLDYVTLDRAASTLSAGESQRIRLASQIGSGLTGVLYVLDEPSIGLHQRDNERLLNTLVKLRDMGNSVLVVEHDADIILAADHVIDMGPGAGVQGGRVVASGTPEEIMQKADSLTGQYLSGEKSIPVPLRRRMATSKSLTITDVCTHNLKNITAKFPLGFFIAVTGVSGSGKSSLVVDTLAPAVRNAVSGGRSPSGSFGSLQGTAHVKRVLNVSQAPIGRTPRSNPATYSGVFTHIREIFAQIPESRARGYGPGRYSFNVKGGRCEACRGDGLIRVEMQFLPDVFVTCEVCNGKRYNRETLEIRYRGRSIADVLNMTVEEALDFLKNIPRVREKLETLNDVGLGYIKLGQSATTLSGGEAQRLKLSRELSRKTTGRALYILDEPTTGLHFADMERLLKVINALVDAGNTVIVIEHNMDVIKCADWVIDIGPEGGVNGGSIVAQGRPADIALSRDSHTGRFLRPVLGIQDP